MFALLNVLALLVMAAIVYVGWIQGLHRAAMTLVACILAGVIAFGFFGPLAGVLPSSAPRTTWYFTADALCLWGLFCCVFLGLRTLGHRLLRQESPFPFYPGRAGGALLALATGYLSTGVCLVLLQMLPMSPAIMGAYSPFKYDRAANQAVRGAPLWLRWDRGTLEFFGFLSRTLGFEDHGLFDRYGDVYADPADAAEAKAAGADAKPVPDVDDFLYYHWYRRWEFVRWRTGVAQGPVPSGLERGYRCVMHGIRAEIGRAEAARQIDFFRQERLGEDEQFLFLDLTFGPAGGGPADIDSAQFVLLGPEGERFTQPMVHGLARVLDEKPQIVSRVADVAEERDLRFSIPDPKKRPEGRYLMSGARFSFKAGKQEDLRTFIFIVPKRFQAADLRLVVEPPKKTAAAP